MLNQKTIHTIVKSQGFKKTWWIIVKILQEVVNIWTFLAICLKLHADMKNQANSQNG